MRALPGALRLAACLGVLWPGSPGAAEPAEDRAIRLVLGLGSSAFRATDRLDAYYGDTEFLGEVSVEYAPWPRVPWRPYVGLVYLVLPFDQAGFDRYEGLNPGGTVDANAGKLLLSSSGFRGFPLPRYWIRPFLQVSLVYGTFKEKYEYGQLTPGPIFPSGTLKGRNTTVSYVGLGLGSGVRIDLAREFQPYVAVDLIWLTGGESDISLVPIRAGVCLVVDERE